MAKLERFQSKLQKVVELQQSDQKAQAEINEIKFKTKLEKEKLKAEILRIQKS